MDTWKMMTPNAKLHNPDPAYLRKLIEIIGMAQEDIAAKMGVNNRLFRMYIANRKAKSAQTCTYPVQFCLEAMANSANSDLFDDLQRQITLSEDEAHE